MLNSYLKNLNDYAYTPTEALNTVKAVATTQAANENNTNYRNYMNLLGNFAIQTPEDYYRLYNTLNNNSNANMLQQLLGQL